MRSMTDRGDARHGRRGAWVAAAVVVLASLGAARCGGGTPARAGGPPPAAVEAITLEATPVERTSEFVGTVKSRASTTIQPQVEGIITRILVTSGDRVKPGDVLMEIDAERQQAAVARLESVRAARQADARLARQQAERAKTLLDAGAGSQQEYDQARPR